MSNIEHLLANNKQWAARSREQDPQFFARLAEQQNPNYLWIGCSDSRVAANTIVDLPPGEIFVHRNVANLVNQADLNCLSVIQFAVEVLRVEHIIVCGHYACGGVKAAMDGVQYGLIDEWLGPIRNTANLHKGSLDSITDEQERLNELCQLNVAEQVLNVGQTLSVKAAWDRQQPLAIHGWIYGLKDGLIHDLDISIRHGQNAANATQF